MDRLDGLTDSGTVPNELGRQAFRAEKVAHGFVVPGDEAARATDVDQVGCCPLDRQMRGSNLWPTVDDVVDVPKVQGSGEPVQFNVGWAEPGLPVVGILAEEFCSSFRLPQQVVGRASVLVTCSRHSCAQVEHAEQAQRGGVVVVHAVTQPRSGRDAEAERVVVAAVGEKRMGSCSSRRGEDEWVVGMLCSDHGALCSDPRKVRFTELAQRRCREMVDSRGDSPAQAVFPGVVLQALSRTL